MALTSSVAEVLRGLGYWFFYGHEKLGPRVAASDPYIQDIWLIVASFSIPVLAMFARRLAQLARTGCSSCCSSSPE